MFSHHSYILKYLLAQSNCRLYPWYRLGNTRITVSIKYPFGFIGVQNNVLQMDFILSSNNVPFSCVAFIKQNE